MKAACDSYIVLFEKFWGGEVLPCDADVLGLGKKARLRHAYGAAGAALRSTSYFAMQMFFASVKNLNASSPPSRPTPLAFMPPNGTRRSRTSQQFTQTVPV
jgi:hypothetical protein